MKLHAFYSLSPSLGFPRGFCRPQALGRLLERVVDEMADDIHFVEVDITESPDVAQNAGITGTPTVQVKMKNVWKHVWVLRCFGKIQVKVSEILACWLRCHTDIGKLTHFQKLSQRWPREFSLLPYRPPCF